MVQSHWYQNVQTTKEQRAVQCTDGPQQTPWHWIGQWHDRVVNWVASTRHNYRSHNTITCHTSYSKGCNRALEVAFNRSHILLNKPLMRSCLHMPHDAQLQIQYCYYLIVTSCCIPGEHLGAWSKEDIKKISSTWFRSIAAVLMIKIPTI